MFTAKALLEYTDIAPANAFVQEYVPNSFLELQLEFNAEIQRAEVEYNRAYYRALTESIIHEEDDSSKDGFLDAIGRAFKAFIDAIQKAWNWFIGLFKKNKADIENKANETKANAKELKEAIDSGILEKVSGKILKDDEKKRLTEKYKNEFDSVKRTFIALPDYDLSIYNKIVEHYKEVALNYIEASEKIFNAADIPNEIATKYKIPVEDAAHVVGKINKLGETDSIEFINKMTNSSDNKNTNTDKLVSLVIKNADTDESTMKDFLSNIEKYYTNAFKALDVIEKTITTVDKDIKARLKSIEKSINSKSKKEKKAYPYRVSLAFTKAGTTSSNEIISFNNKLKNNINGTTNKIDSIIKGFRDEIKKDVAKSNGESNPQKQEKVDESAYIHGEPFNGNTLFDNEDIRDFNRTEWLDLRMTTEYYQLESDLLDIKEKLALKEAVILTDPTITNKLVRLREEQEAAKEGVWARIKRFFQKAWEWFMSFFKKTEEISAKAAENIDANNEFVAKPFSFNSNVKSKGDILGGMYRIQKNITFVEFNEATMELLNKENGKMEFFKTKIMNSMDNDRGNFGKVKIPLEGEMKIADWCKYYYGAALSDEEYKKHENELQFTNDELNQNKDNIIKFVKNIKAYTNSIEADKNKIEAECRRLSENLENKAKQNASTPPPQNNNQDQNNTTGNNSKNKNESMYYSVLYGRNITINAFNEVEVPKDNAADNAAADNKESENEEKAIKAYIEVYNEIISAKLTAAEFIHSELNGIIKGHIEVQGGRNKAEEEAKKAAEGQANANQQAQAQTGTK